MQASTNLLLTFVQGPATSSQARPCLRPSEINGRKRNAIGGVAKALLIIGLVYAALIPGTLSAATITAASCSRADVGIAVERAVNGDTVLIPPGTCSWTTNLTISDKYFTLQGAGINQTVIIDNVNKSGYPIVPQALVWNTINGGLTRVTGITWQGGTTVDSGPNKGMVIFQGNSKLLRIDHNKFIPTQTSAVMLSNGVVGVFDHNICDLSAAKGFCSYLWHFDWTIPGSGNGDDSWAKDDTLGTDQAMFYEDNLITNDQSHYFFYYAWDGWAGARVVMRNNSFVNTVVGSHGTESGGRQRGLRQFEFYNNTFTFNAQGLGQESWFDMRSGTGVIFNNTATVTNPASGLRTVAYFKIFRTADPYSPWGKCNGTSAWDGNTSPPGYPCLDQMGWAGGDRLVNYDPINSVLGAARWPRQTLRPIYVWNNTINGVISDAISQQPTYTQEGREFFNRTPKPGYVPFRYPHPLVTSTGTTNPPPSPPQNVTVR